MQVELDADPLQYMGVSATINIIENLSVTLPPSRLLPIHTLGLSYEQWLLLELAALRSEEQKLLEEENYEYLNREEEAKGGKEAGYTLVKDLREKNTLNRLGTIAAVVGPCRLRRGKGFHDKVILDCLPKDSTANSRNDSKKKIKNKKE